MSMHLEPPPYPTAAADLSDSRLVIVSHEPVNAETRLDAHPGLITPQRAFYKRNHYAIPALDLATWHLTVRGAVGQPLDLSFDDLRALPSTSHVVTLECAGNGRAGLWPPVEGEPWAYGAVSTAEWTGVPCAVVLDLAHVSSAACELVAIGADTGRTPGSNQAEPFVRGMSLAKAMHPDTMLAYAMNGEPLRPEHGFPVRLIVPGWYGMASVKWVTCLEAWTEPFQGYYQAERYIMAYPEADERTPAPLTATLVRSLITEPAANAQLRGPRHVIRGFAWSGAAPIASVEVSFDGGTSWEPTELSPDVGRYAWRRWEYVWQVTRAGRCCLKSRATDIEGNTQPREPVWNRLGYANNAIHSTDITVAP